MQRSPTWKLLLVGIGYMLLGSVMGTIITVAMSFMIDQAFMCVILFIFALFIFFSLVFLPAYKDGIKERKLVQNKRVSSPEGKRWLPIGFTMTFVMCIPTIILLFAKFAGIWDSYIITYRLICGTIYPLSLLCGVTDISTMNIAFPIVVIAIYLLIPVATSLGFYCGYNDKLNTTRIMYK